MQIIEAATPPAWISPELEKLIAERGRVTWEITLTRAERKVLNKNRPIKTSVWAERNRILTMSAIPGQWHNEVTPYLTGIMDAADDPGIREITLCKAPQVGGSEAVHNIVGKRIDRNPAPIIYVYPDKMTAQENAKDRILPMIKSSPALREYLTNRIDDEASIRINLKHIPVYLAWSGSVSRLGNKPAGVVIFDETDKYFRTRKREADTISLGRKRVTTYKDKYLLVYISTPTLETGYIWELFNAADCRFDFAAHCQACGEFQIMIFDQIKWAGGSAADQDEMRNKRLAWYECQKCRAKWNDGERNVSVLGGHWIERETGLELFDYLKAFKPAHIAFHIPAWISRFVSLSDCAAAFLGGLKNVERLHDFMNAIKAEPFKNIVITADEKTLEKCKVDLKPGTVPGEAVALTAAVDVQKSGFWYSVRAWHTAFTSWLIDYGFLGTWEEIETLLFETRWPVVGTGETAGLWRRGIDTGGGRYGIDATMTETTYLWIQRNKARAGGRLFVFLGSRNPQSLKIKLGTELKTTPSGKPLKTGFRLLFTDTDIFKEIFFDRINKAMNRETGAAYLHSGAGVDYMRQILSEQKQINKDGSEQWVKVRADNHLLDCEVIHAALVDWEMPGGGVNLLTKYITEKAETRPAPPVITSKFLKR